MNQDSAPDIKIPAVARRRPSKLPRFPSAFVGREREIKLLSRRLEDSPMVTLTGAGGMGKTRLALELSAMVSARYPDGVVFVDLAPLTDESLVPRTIAWALGLFDDGVRDPMGIIMAHLDERSTLMVLDNCEHVLSAVTTAATEMLAQCRGLTILATSREALGIQGETIWEVPALGNRMHGSAIVPKDSDDGDAVELFRLRAAASAPKSFVWDEAVVGDVIQICDKLDGIPLAIELAAARLRVMPFGDLLAGLEARFDILRSGTRTGSPRHQSLEATIDWSYQLLSPPEQSLLQRLSVFAGGFTPEAAEKVCGDEQLPQAGVVQMLFSLVEKSLIRLGTGVGGGGRYSMLETIREFSRNKLQATAGEVEVQKRHATYFSDMASPTESTLRSARQLEWLAHLEEEHDNFRAAFDWAIAEDPQLALEIATKLGEFWMRRHIGEGTMWVERAIEAATPTEEQRARAVDVAGQLAWAIGDHKRSRAMLSEAMKRWAALGDLPRAGHAADLLAVLYAEAGDHELALIGLHQAVELLRPTGDSWSFAHALNDLGFTQHLAGDSLAAIAFLGEALELARQADDPYVVALVLDSIGSAEMSLGRHDEARAHWHECFAIAMRLDNIRLTSGAFDGRARLAFLEKDPELCIRLASAGDAARRSIGLVMPDYWRGVVGATVEASRRQLPATVADAAWLEGQTMTAPEMMAAQSRADALGAQANRREPDDRSASSTRSSLKRTFMFTDVVGSTRLVEAIGDDAWADVVTWHDTSLRRLFHQFDGEEVDRAGDGFFVAFSESTKAIDCAIAIQRALADHRRRHGFAPNLRIGVHSAQSTRLGNSFLGRGVHEASRIAASAEANQILVSAGSVPPGIKTTDQMLITAKGLSEPLKVVALRWE